MDEVIAAIDGHEHHMIDAVVCNTDRATGSRILPGADAAGRFEKRVADFTISQSTVQRSTICWKL